MQLVDRDAARDLAMRSRQTAGWLYHTDSRNEPHMSRQSLPTQTLQTPEGSACVDLSLTGAQKKLR